MTCSMCQKWGKTWQGNEPICYFDDPKGNWNCATLGAIRDICYEGQAELPEGVHYEYCDDEKFATINIHDIEDDKGRYIGRCLYVAWYKNRGATEAIWILDGEGDTPRQPTEQELLAIIRHFPKGRRARMNCDEL